MTAPVEVTTRYATSVNELGDAWAFVMSKVDLVGPDPSVKISPIWTIQAGTGDELPRRFSVVVEGMVPEETGR